MSHITQEQIFNFAKEAGFKFKTVHFNPPIIGVQHSNGSWISVSDELTAFANLVVAALAQPEPVEPADTRVHLAGPDTPVYYVLHADGIYSEANPQPAQPEPVELTDEQILSLNAGEVFFSESPSKFPEFGHGTQYHAGAPGVIGFARAVMAAANGGDK